MSLVPLLASAVLLSSLLYCLLTVGHRGKDLPPGPPTLPILGNIHQIPKRGAHFQLTAWARQYGGIYSLKLGTGTAVVLTSRTLVKGLLDRKSSIYSARPRSFVANLISGGDHILLMQYGAQWRAIRKLCHADLAERVADERHLPLQEAEARQMLADYLSVDPSGDEHMLLPKRFSNSVAMGVVWGARTPRPDTAHMRRLYSVMEIWSKVMETGATPPVDIYPFLHRLPQSIFHNWVDRATHVRNEMNGLYRDFLANIRTRRAAQGSRNSLMDRALDQAEGPAPSRSDSAMRTGDHELWFMGGALTEGGSDTSASIITAFVQAMVVYPEVQRKARAQIDAVVGGDRSPTWSDYSSLPYVAQCVKETMRWRPVTPLAFPHAVTRDDWVEAEGGERYFVPEGSTVILNAWGLHNDPTVFPNPETFDPDRYAGVTALAPELANGSPERRDHYGYGAGRRFCPGAHIAERNLFLAMSKLLWAFEIFPGRGEEGKGQAPDVDPKTGYCEGFLVCANGFKAGFEVRSGERRETILRELEEVRGVFQKFE
ncbi:putative cytochrome P450 [Polychaeton citri CBS 116435]|uniref:Cytochrome P450 n=1 Tax=Polychaeton citri CBS 116435 TaxID=1314669 RepID=A0A9P4UNN4_9PEZI|nr:putative cytochrome P450 [Polychaeton citri CBS 116435]